MRSPWRTWMVLLILGVGACGLMVWWAEAWSAALERADNVPARPDGNVLRLVSLAPSLTETVFALGAGDRLAGVCEYCRHPPAAARIPRVGQYHAPNIERIFSVQPDLVLLLSEHAPSIPALDAAGLRHMTFDQRSWDGILESFAALGSLLDRDDDAKRLIEDWSRRQTVLESKNADRPRPRTLVSISRLYGSGAPREVYAAGRDNLYDRLLTIAGGRNAYEGEQAFPVFSAEGILQLAPEAIIEILPVDAGGAPSPDGAAGGMEGTVDVEGARRDWSALAQLPAVRDGRLYFLQADYAYIPGPRFIQVAEDFHRFLHE